MEDSKIKIVFVGTPEFGAIILEKLITSEYKPILVITSSDKPVGRKQILTASPVKTIAQKYNIPVEQPERIEDWELKIETSKPDLGIIAAYGQILPKDILDIPKFGFLNVHPSLLPKYRGPSPIQAVILNSDKRTAVTIILMDEKIDHGPIIAQRTLEIEEGETAETLHNKLAELGARLLLETIPKWVKKMIKPLEQNDSEATFTKILTRESGKINWEKPAELLEREVRAYLPWPGSYTFWEKIEKSIKIEILKARIFKSPSGIGYPIGKTIVVPQNEIAVQCGKGFLKGAGDYLIIERLKMEGKKEMNSEDFIRGFPNFIGTILT